MSRRSGGRPASQADPAGPPQCPAWCDVRHSETEPSWRWHWRTHLGMGRTVPLTAMPAVAGRIPMLMYDLIQQPDGEPVIRMRRDGRPLVRLAPGEALSLARGLVALVDQAHAEREGRA
jgi:hypothetical protein